MSEARTRVTVVKQVENATLYSNGHIKISNVIISHPHVFEKYVGQVRPGQSNTPAYSCSALLGKKTHKAAKDLIVEVIKTLCKENKVNDVAADRKFITNGDDKAKDELVGMWVVSSRDTKNKPFCRDAKKNPIDSKNSDEVYGGMIGNIVIRPWFCDNEYGKRVSAGIIGIQKIKDGEPLGDATRITDDDVDDMLDDEDGDVDGDEAAGDDDDDL